MKPAVLLATVTLASHAHAADYIEQYAMADFEARFAQHGINALFDHGMVCSFPVRSVALIELSALEVTIEVICSGDFSYLVRETRGEGRSKVVAWEQPSAPRP